MKTTIKHLSVAACAFASLGWPSSNSMGQAMGENLDAREAYRLLQLQDENGQIPPDGWINAYGQKDAMPFLPEAWSEFSSAAQIEAGIAGGVWTSIGPGNIGGRIRSIVIKPLDPTHPDDPRTMWAGGVGGGVWKTTNCCGDSTFWTTNTDMMANLAVTSMAMDPTNPNIIYAGTGEGFLFVDSIPGNGIFKTTNGGDSWNQLANTSNNPDFTYVNRLAISPTNAQIILAAIRRDTPPYGKILRSTNGGTDWTTVKDLPFYGGVADVSFRPPVTTNVTLDSSIPAINCLASTWDGQVYYSADSGATWATYAGNGLPPPGGFRRIELAYSRSQPLTVYASRAQADNTPDGLDRLYRSDDGGYTFQATGASPSVSSGLPGAWYHANSLWVDPFDPTSNTVIVGGEYMLRTTDGGNSWNEASNIETHVDHHVIVEDPGYNRTTNRLVYGGNDGGIHFTTNILSTPSHAFRPLDPSKPQARSHAVLRCGRPSRLRDNYRRNARQRDGPV